MTKVEISLVKKKIEKGPIKLRDGYEIYALAENGEIVSPFIPLPRAFADRMRLKLASEDNVKNIIKVAFQDAQPLSVEFQMPDFSLIRRIKGMLTSFLHKIDKKIEEREDQLDDVDVVCMACGETGFKPPLEYEPGDGYMFVCDKCLREGDEVNDENDNKKD